MTQKEAASSSLADLAALGKLFEDHQARLLDMLRRRIDPALAVRLDAEDILAETYLLARQKWPSYKDSGMRPYPWLYRLALDTLIEAWRKHNRAGRQLENHLPLPEDPSVHMGLSLIAHSDGPRTKAAIHEMRERMRQTLGLLKEKDRDILWMRHNDQLSFAEAADVLGVTENAATVRYVRALQRLKEVWGEGSGFRE